MYRFKSQHPPPRWLLTVEVVNLNRSQNPGESVPFIPWFYFVSLLQTPPVWVWTWSVSGTVSSWEINSTDWKTSRGYGSWSGLCNLFWWWLLGGNLCDTPQTRLSLPTMRFLTCPIFQKPLRWSWSWMSTMSPSFTSAVAAPAHFHCWWAPLSSKRYSLVQRLQKWLRTLAGCLNLFCMDSLLTSKLGSSSV